ncbi:hypothetical protein RFI_02559 [Reticulomyxa filosa]|uniref:Uncharacterized protein n=1 Tax=Reticulomyxa filosa TaxID=46433 RepID=X6P7N9_RETFI|nr:hypothetical protein RFI_02559 [Reticulomyxa filosa]|eukprot:ETO34535.1 hypothetical protein RFI_02559 [Reticulomyxa filosa]
MTKFKAHTNCQFRSIKAQSKKKRNLRYIRKATSSSVIFVEVVCIRVMALIHTVKEKMSKTLKFETEYWIINVIWIDYLTLNFQVNCQFIVSKYSFKKKRGLSVTFQKSLSNMSSQINNIFQSLSDLPKPFACPQCILFKDEILICGADDCYSYHTMKKQYKYICSYPNDVQLSANYVVQLTHSQTNPSEIHLLSFGGQCKNEMKQTLFMKYKSVWEISDDQCDSKSEHDSISQSFNTWIRHDQNANIGKLEANFEGARGLIGGINNDLLFITHSPKNIEVIDLKTMKSLTEIKNDIIPTEQHKYGLEYHCFVPLTINNEKVINHFILFCKNTGLLIKYDEQNKIFNYENYQFALL